MILKKKQENSVGFEEIAVGEAFMELDTNSGIYIKTQQFSQGNVVFNAVRLLDGDFKYFCAVDYVGKCKAKVVY